MKKKVVREIYATICQWAESETRLYNRGIIPFEDYLEEQANTIRNAREALYIEQEAGRITEEEAHTIAERFKAFVKKEIKNACKA